MLDDQRSVNAPTASPHPPPSDAAGPSRMVVDESAGCSNLILDDLPGRLARLEAECRTLRHRLAARRPGRCAAGVALGLACAAGIMGQSAPDTRPPASRALEAETVVARRYFITAADGARRGAFTVLDDGTAAVLLSDPRCRAAAGLTVALDGTSSLVLSDRDGRTRVDVNIEPNGTPHVLLQDSQEKRRIELSALPDGAPQIDLFDRGGNRRVRLAVDNENWGRMQLLDHADRPRVTLMSRPDDAGGLFLIDKDGANRLTLLNKGSGDPVLTLHDREMRTIWKAP